MGKKISAMDIYKLLPKINCKKCGESSCMAFATKLQERKASLDQCPILQSPKFEKNRRKLEELLSPPVKEVWFGYRDRKVVLGGEEVMYRYELTFFNPTAIGIDISDTLSEEEIRRRAKFIEDFVFERTGEKLKLDFIALRNASNDPEKFLKALNIIQESTKVPVALCSLNVESIERALDVVKSKPMIYPVTEQNFSEMMKMLISKKKKDKKEFAVVLSSSNIKTLKGMVKASLDHGIEDIILEPHTTPENIMDTLDRFVMIRRSAIERGDKLLGYPILGLPINTYFYVLGGNNPVRQFVKELDKAAAIMEASAACAMLNRYADGIIIHGTEVWELMPILTLRQAIYTDPRKPQTVEPGLYPIGNPDENSPVIMTTNFSLTFYTVTGDFEKDGVTCWLLVMDTEGKAVDVAVAGGQYCGENARKLIEETKIGEKVNHRIIILPGLAAPVRGDIEEKTGWTCVVGTRDSSQVGEFLRKNWNRILEEWRAKEGAGN
ncbi:MAG TPA: acetyl-CoA decarbonylase/synthase complex subunit gamma [Methanothermococcus okinawensis]|uniref:Acetyl-CoA decarbonylase/synthase complex subunit gamma n=1 Tax=Methanothermococcus okinawensis TaxID=155863 RepID=A0A833DZZ3_9EURY|nr:acetyl-CoA decarbonylase/synthase complex subunit gamma [Methanothermococcus okinawensis]HIP91108.1 acetyl-CoA decarbonylase/synthase complex subunit gamma [Methanothermococcus okinawensis]